MRGIVQSSMRCDGSGARASAGHSFVGLHRANVYYAAGPVEVPALDRVRHHALHHRPDNRGLTGDIYELRFAGPEHEGVGHQRRDRRLRGGVEPDLRHRDAHGRRDTSLGVDHAHAAEELGVANPLGA